jgi:hypothetical protein
VVFASGGRGYARRVYAQPNLMPWVDALREDVDGIELYDAHVHLGLRDPAALLATEEEALDALEQVGSRALIFALKEPAGYARANRHLLELAEAHPDRLRGRAAGPPITSSPNKSRPGSSSIAARSRFA